MSPAKTIDTEREKALSNRRKGARKVRSAIQEEIQAIEESFKLSSPNEQFYAGVQAGLHTLRDYISLMVERDKKRKGGLWN